MNLDELLCKLVERGGSDLHLKVGRPPLFRIAGDLLASSFPEVTRSEMQESMLRIMSLPVKKKFEKTLEANFAYEVAGAGRFRVNAFVQRQEIAGAFRYVPLEVPSIDSLGLPDILKDIGNHPNGLVVISGPAGSGKSTTLAAIVQHINQNRPAHVMIIEDPIEFVYVDELATINQRELGVDTFDLLSALRSALRQDPDVIVMGEMRDQATMEFAITAAETGHLVFSTLHTSDAKHTLSRIIDAFSKSEYEKQIRVQLAMTLRAVISQRLIKRADGKGRISAVEILTNSPNVRQALLDGDTSELDKVMENDTYYKMRTFNQALLELVKKGAITEEQALATSGSPENLKLAFRGVVRKGAADAFDRDFDSSARGKAPGAKSGIQRGFDF